MLTNATCTFGNEDACAALMPWDDTTAPYPIVVSLIVYFITPFSLLVGVFLMLQFGVIFKKYQVSSSRKKKPSTRRKYNRDIIFSLAMSNILLAVSSSVGAFCTTTPLHSVYGLVSLMALSLSIGFECCASFWAVVAVSRVLPHNLRSNQRTNYCAKNASYLFANALILIPFPATVLLHWVFGLSQNPSSVMRVFLAAPTILLGIYGIVSFRVIIPLVRNVAKMGFRNHAEERNKALARIFRIAFHSLFTSSWLVIILLFLFSDWFAEGRWYSVGTFVVATGKLLGDTQILILNIKKTKRVVPVSTLQRSQQKTPAAEDSVISDLSILRENE